MMCWRIHLGKVFRYTAFKVVSYKLLQGCSMGQHIIVGQKRLSGEINISGAKNSVLPILIASILSNNSVQIKNTPNLDDVSTSLNLLKSIGVKVSIVNNNTIEINTLGIKQYSADKNLASSMRASILMLGPLLARFGIAQVSYPGGCKIGARPVDLHIAGLEALGAKIEIVDDSIVAKAEHGLTGGRFRFGVVTVTGTENIIMAACLAKGKTILENVAREPEVVDLCDFLNTLGAKISGAGTSTIEIEGVESLGSGTFTVLPDRIETGTYLLAAIMTKGEITATSTRADTLSAPLDLMSRAGAEVSYGSDWITVSMRERPKAVSIVTGVYPSFPTDLQPQFMAMNAVAEGVSIVEETIFENRFRHVPNLIKMGAKIELDGNTAKCWGVPSLKGTTVVATDLRASASLVLAGLVAKGTTVIDSVAHTDRGYEQIENKLESLGASIKRVAIAV